MQKIQSSFYKKVTANVEGRDFIVGDLHGCYDELMNLMLYVEFDTKKDRIFCTGDLIDRGPKSIECLSLLERDWFYSVIGNHEDLILNKFLVLKNNDTDGMTKEEIEYYSKIMEYEELILKMPLVLEIDNIIHEKIHIVHAEILPEHIAGILESDEKKYELFLNSMKTMNLNHQMKRFFKSLEDEKISFSLKQKLLWSRKLIHTFFKEHNDDLEIGDLSFLSKHKNNLEKMKIFSGHNVVPFPMKVNQQYYIDTGAAFGYSDKELNSSVFTQFGHSFFTLSMIDVATGMCFGCVTSPQNRGEILKLETLFMSDNEEILRYDLIINSFNEYEIHLPVHNLVNPKIFIQNDILFIKLKNKSFKIINLEKNILNLIKQNKVIFKNINNEIIVYIE